MIGTQCQVCGRRKPLRQDGTIVHHYRQGWLCAGTGFAPAGAATDAIERAIAIAQAADDRHMREWQRHRELRLNEPLQAAFWSGWAAASREVSRLTTRLRRCRRLAA